MLSLYIEYNNSVKCAVGMEDKPQNPDQCLVMAQRAALQHS